MIKLLQSYIRNEISTLEFSKAVCSLDGIEKKVGRSRFLRLKHGDKATALMVFQTINECSVCSQLYTDDLAHSNNVRSTMDKLIQDSKLERTCEPLWYTPHLAKKNPYGAQGFFTCKACGTIIDVCEPERMYAGCCEVIG
mgnify:CR=1 FL=1